MKRRFFFPKFNWRILNAIACFLCTIIAFGNFFFGDIHHATFWGVMAIFNYIAHKM